MTSGIQTIGQDLFGTAIPLTRVTFRHPKPTDTSLHEKVFGVEPTFDTDSNTLAFDATLLDLPLPQANDWALRSYDQLCRELVTRRHARTGLAGSVHNLLTRHPAKLPDQAAVAAELHMSTRTLFRRLSEEGTSYRALVDEVRETRQDSRGAPFRPERGRLSTSRTRRTSNNDILEVSTSSASRGSTPPVNAITSDTGDDYLPITEDLNGEPDITDDTCFHQMQETVDTKRAMFDAAANRVLLVDHTKFERRGFARARPAGRVRPRRR